MKDKQLILVAKLFSVLFAPHYFPLLCILILISFTPMKMLNINHNILVLVLVYIFTVALPTILISSYRKFMNSREHQLTRRELRTVPYILSIACYMTCCYLMVMWPVINYAICVVATALLVQVVCLIVNNWHRVSTHSAAGGAVNGALIAFSIVNHFNPMWWLCFTLIIGGCLCSSRLILRRHTQKEVYLGFLLGFITSFLAVMLM